MHDQKQAALDAQELEAERERLEKMKEEIARNMKSSVEEGKKGEEREEVAEMSESEIEDDHLAKERSESPLSVMGNQSEDMLSTRVVELEGETTLYLAMPPPPLLLLLDTHTLFLYPSI